MEMSEDEVLSRFASLKNAQRVGEGQEQFVFIPGTRDDRILLVAHSDTVFHRKPKVAYSNGTLFSKIKGVGIGADDRAGCAMAWHLKDMGHSILIPNGEESGCRGSRFLMRNSDWAKEINDTHRFAIEMDRMNKDDIAFYDIATDKFKDWCEDQFKGYYRCRGSVTDVCALCETICGCNISVGYYGQHGSGETLKVKEWERTLYMMRKVLGQKDLPLFKQDPKPVYTPPCIQNNYNTAFTSKSLSQKIIGLELDDIITCIHCDMIMDIHEYKMNGKKCTNCQKEF